MSMLRRALSAVAVWRRRRGRYSTRGRPPRSRDRSVENYETRVGEPGHGDGLPREYPVRMDSRGRYYLVREDGDAQGNDPRQPEDD